MPKHFNQVRQKRKKREETKVKSDEYSRGRKQKVIKQETRIRSKRNKWKKEMKISAEAKPKQTV